MPMMFQFPFHPPPDPDTPLAPPVVFQILLCVLFVYVWFETVVLFLPEKWRDRISALQFGRWTAKKGGQ
jgi:hypothetical protein